MKEVAEVIQYYNCFLIKISIILIIRNVIIAILIINLTIYILILAIPINRNYRKIFLPFRFNKDH
jgi:hypothetical protein